MDKGALQYMDKTLETVTAIRTWGLTRKVYKRCILGWCKSHQILCFRIECNGIPQTETSQADKAITSMARTGCGKATDRSITCVAPRTFSQVCFMQDPF